MNNSIWEFIKNLFFSQTSFLGQKLALLYERLKFENPIAYLVTMALSVGVLWAGENCMFNICQNEWVVGIVEIISLAAITLTKPSSWSIAQAARGNKVTFEEQDGVQVTKVSK